MAKGMSMVKALEHHVRACRVESCRRCVGKRRAGSDSLKQFMFALLYQKTSQFPSKVYKPTADALKEPAFLR
jgi:hypothetical protein